jgi:hypothetical protein
MWTSIKPWVCLLTLLSTNYPSSGAHRCQKAKRSANDQRLDPSDPPADIRVRTGRFKLVRQTAIIRVDHPFGTGPQLVGTSSRGLEHPGPAWLQQLAEDQLTLQSLTLITAPWIPPPTGVSQHRGGISIVAQQTEFSNSIASLDAVRGKTLLELEELAAKENGR